MQKFEFDEDKIRGEEQSGGFEKTEGFLTPSDDCEIIAKIINIPKIREIKTEFGSEEKTIYVIDIGVVQGVNSILRKEEVVDPKTKMKKKEEWTERVELQEGSKYTLKLNPVLRTKLQKLIDEFGEELLNKNIVIKGLGSHPEKNYKMYYVDVLDRAIETGKVKIKEA